jgi:predicted ATPase
MVTVVGPGGMGKTRLAVEAARLVAHVFSDGVWLVELVSLEHAEGVGHAVVGVLGVQARGGLGAVELAGRFLAGRRALLVMNNCEHVMDTARDIVDELLRTAPGLVVLATSRRPLGSVAEQVRTLGPTLRQYGEARLGGRAEEHRARHPDYFAEAIGRAKAEPTTGRGAFAESILEDFPNIRVPSNLHS